MSSTPSLLTVENPKKLRQLIESTMAAEGEEDGLEGLLATTKPPSDHLAHDEDNGRILPIQAGGPKGDLRVRSSIPAAITSTPIPRGDIVTKQPPEGAAEKEAYVSLPGTPDEQEAPPSESASGLPVPTTKQETRKPQTELEAFEIYLEEEFDRKLSAGLQATRTLAEDRYTSIVTVVTKLQRRVEVLEQRTALQVSRPTSVDLTTIAPPRPRPGGQIAPASEGTKPPGSGQLVEAISGVLDRYRTPPSKVVRHVCMSGLLRLKGIGPDKHVNDPTDKEWTLEGIQSWIDRIA